MSAVIGSCRGDGLSSSEVAAVDKTVLRKAELDAYNEDRLVASNGRAVVDVADVSEYVVLVVISDRSSRATVDSGGDDSAVEGVLEKVVGDDAVDGCIVGVATSTSWM